MSTEAEDDVVGVCSECHSDQPDQYMMKSPFAQAGSPTPCKYCGGIVIILDRRNRDKALNQSDAQRGLT